MADRIDLDEGRGDRMTMAEARTATTQPPFDRDRAWVLMPAWLAEQLPTLATFQDQEDPQVLARWFGGEGWSWHVLAYDRESHIAYAYVISPHVPEGEFGDVDVAELEAATMFRMPAVERDLLITTPYPLSDIIRK